MLERLIGAAICAAFLFLVVIPTITEAGLQIGR
jgi:hypothetical protein